MSGRNVTKPSPYTRQAQLVGLLKAGRIPKQACHEAGVKTATFYAYMRNPRSEQERTFKAAIEDAMGKPWGRKYHRVKCKPCQSCGVTLPASAFNRARFDEASGSYLAKKCRVCVAAIRNRNQKIRQLGEQEKRKGAAKRQAEIMRVKQALEDTTKEYIREVLRSAADEADMSYLELLKMSRQRPLPRLRGLAMYVLSQTTMLTLQQIGASVGITNHTTVQHWLSKVSSDDEMLARANAVRWRVENDFYKKETGRMMRGER